MKPGKLTDRPILPCFPNLHLLKTPNFSPLPPSPPLRKKKRNATTFLSLTHSQTLFSFPNLFGDSLVFSKQGSYTSLSYYTKEETWLFNKAWLLWHCSISLWLVLTGTDVTTRITATTRSNRFLENDFFFQPDFPIMSVLFKNTRKSTFFFFLKGVPVLCRSPDWKWY